MAVPRFPIPISVNCPSLRKLINWWPSGILRLLCPVSTSIRSGMKRRSQLLRGNFVYFYSRALDPRFTHPRHRCSAPSAVVELEGGNKVLNFASTNFLGMAEDPEIKVPSIWQPSFFPLLQSLLNHFLPVQHSKRQWLPCRPTVAVHVALAASTAPWVRSGHSIYLA
jgi:hypothetical protein